MAAGGTASPAAMIQRTVSTRRQGCASPGCKKRRPPLTPLRDKRLPTVRRPFQYQSRYWRESFVCTLDTGRLMGGPFVPPAEHVQTLAGVRNFDLLIWQLAKGATCGRRRHLGCPVQPNAANYRQQKAMRSGAFLCPNAFVLLAFYEPLNFLIMK